jgi:hypothetical protein
MHHVFVSYSSADYPSAAELVAYLRRAGFLVWVDFGTEGPQTAGELGIPAGQPHWDAIAQAIDRCDAFVIVWTRAWAQSDYCLKEVGYAQSLGKRIFRYGSDNGGDPPVATSAVPAVVTDSEQQLMSLIRENSELAQAHTRLTSLIPELGSGRISPVEYVTGVRGLLEAQALSTQNLDTAHLSLNADQRDAVSSILATSEKRRKVLRGVATGVVVAMILAAITSFAGQRSAMAENARKQLESDHSRGLTLAESAINSLATDSLSALRDSDMAVRLFDTRETRSARSIVTADAAISPTFTGMSMTPIAAAVAEDGSTVGVISSAGVHILNTSTGQSRFVRSAARLTRVALLDDGKTGFAVADGDVFRVTPSADTLSERVTDAETDAELVTDLAVGPDGLLWWSNRSGEVWRSPATGPQSEVTLMVKAAGQPSTALWVGDDGAFATLYEDGALAVYNPSGDKVDSINLLPSNAEEAARHRRLEDGIPEFLTRCGSTWHAALAWRGSTALTSRASRSVTATSGTKITYSDETLPANGLACDTGEGSFTSSMFASHPVPSPELARWPSQWDGSARTALAQSRKGTHLVLVDDAGQVSVRRSTATSWSVQLPDTMVALPIADGLVTVSQDGRLGHFDGSVWRPWPAAPTMAWLNGLLVDTQGLGFIMTDTTLVQVTDSGVAHEWPLGQDRGAYQLTELDEDHVLVTTPAQLGIIAKSGRDPIRWLTLPAVGDNDSYVSGDVDLGRGLAVVATRSGTVKVLRLLDFATVAEHETSSGGGGSVMFTENDGRVIVAETTGRVSLLDSSLATVDSVTLPSAIGAVRLHRDFLLVAMTSTNQDLLLDARSLESIQVIADDSWGNGGVVPNADWTVFAVPRSGGSSGGVIEFAPRANRDSTEPGLPQLNTR